MAYQLPVTIHTQKHESGVIQIEYPSTAGLVHPQVTHQINQTIVQLVNWMLEQQKKTQTGTLSQMVGHYEIKTNERGLLSLTLSNYAYSIHMAHGFTIVKSLTFDVNTGRVYGLPDLFKPGSNYIEVISRQVSQQLKQRDLPLLNGFQNIQPNQDYYLALPAIAAWCTSDNPLK
jgi:hypothetical protein